MTQHAEPHHDPRFDDPRGQADDEWMPPELPGQDAPLDRQPDPERADWMPPEHRPPSILGDTPDDQPVRQDPTATMLPTAGPAAVPSAMTDPPMPPAPGRAMDTAPGGIPTTAPGGGMSATAGATVSPAGTGTFDPLWPDAEVARLEGRWREVQLGFVDDPRHAADEARNLLDEVVDRLTRAISDRRSELDTWRTDGSGPGNGTDDTEAMLGAVRRYRRLMDQLLAVGQSH